MHEDNVASHRLGPSPPRSLLRRQQSYPNCWCVTSASVNEVEEPISITMKIFTLQTPENCLQELPEPTNHTLRTTVVENDWCKAGKSHF